MNVLIVIQLIVFPFLLAKAIAAPFTETESSGRIISGTLASPGQFPYLVSITENDQHICGGFIYNDRWIVTAASCVSGKDTSIMKVKVAEYSLVSPDLDEQWITIATVKVHPSFNPTDIVNDLALVQLSRPIVLGPNAQVIKYDELNDESPTATATISGWGATMDGGIVTTRLRYATVVNTAANCKALYTTVQYSQNTMICAGDGSHSPCNYDQGSPLVQNGVVSGIMSKNKSCTSGPTIYTRLTAYYNWLLQNAGQQPA